MKQLNSLYPGLRENDLGCDDQILRGMTDDPCAAADPMHGFVDLRLLRDDKTVHRNPHGCV